MVKRNGRWVRLKRHRTRKAALAHLRALYANVGKKHGGKK